jgi:molecular chaperone DnaK
MYALGVDLGATFTTAAVRRGQGVEVCPLGERSASIPSVLVLRGDGTALVGDAAERRARFEPDRAAREFKRRFGDSIPCVLGGAPYPPEELTARLLSAVVERVSRNEGDPPGALAVSHPASWGQDRRLALRRAVRLARLDQAVTLLTEPEAAAIHHGRQHPFVPGTTVAVYRLGGSSFSATVLRREGGGFEIVGRPEGLGSLGGADVDAAVFAHVTRALGSHPDELDPADELAMAALARLRRACTAAKESLSTRSSVWIPVHLPGCPPQVRLTRAELEELARPELEQTVAVLRRALRSAGTRAQDLDAVLLTGGAARMPLVARLVAEQLGRPVLRDPHPGHCVAQGAAWVSRAR